MKEKMEKPKIKKAKIKEIKNPCPDCGIERGKDELICVYCEHEKEKEPTLKKCKK